MNGIEMIPRRTAKYAPNRMNVIIINTIRQAGQVHLLFVGFSSSGFFSGPFFQSSPLGGGFSMSYSGTDPSPSLGPSESSSEQPERSSDSLGGMNRQVTSFT